MKWLGIFLLALGAAGFWAWTTILESEKPVILTTTQRAFVGPEYVHSAEITDPGRGVQRVRVVLQTADQEFPLEEQSYPGSLFGGATLRAPRRVEVTIRPRELKLPEGRATLVIEAMDFSLRGNRSEVTIPLVIDTQPPRISLRTGRTYVNQGGSELAVYSVGEETARHGIMVGERFYPGFPHPSERGQFAAFYAIPWRTEAAHKSAPAVMAVDRAGNRSLVGLDIVLKEEKERFDEIALSEDFMRRKVSELKGGESEDVLAAYLELNNQMRIENAKQIREICQKTSPERLWTDAFLQLEGSQVGASFAEQRSYTFEGAEVDQQVHLGYDLASTARAPVPAANDGVIAFAGPLGIYGNAVLIDHGMGLFSLYGHLSEISVERGKAVARGDVLGRTGTTGLAGGDHLHFGMLLSGDFVNPLEWFDKKWIDEHLEVKLSPPAPESESQVGAEGALPAAPADE